MSHEKAMAICDRADAMPDRHAARSVYREAARLEELAAANEAPGSIDHAILTRSAAWLWVCGYRPGRAIRIARRALRTRTLALWSQGWRERCRVAGELTDVIQHARGHGPRLRDRRGRGGVTVSEWAAFLPEAIAATGAAVAHIIETRAEHVRAVALNSGGPFVPPGALVSGIEGGAIDLRQAGQAGRKIEVMRPDGSRVLVARVTGPGVLTVDGGDE